MTMLNQQGDAMETTREDGRLLSERYGDLADDAANAEEKAAGYRKELRKQADEMRKLTDPVLALRDAQREYNAAFNRWSELAVTGAANADDLDAAEDDLTEAGLDLEAAEDERREERREDGGRLEPGPGGGGAPGGRRH